MLETVMEALINEPSIHIILTGGLLVLSLILVIWLLVLSISNSRLRKKYQAFMKGADGESIEKRISDYIEAIETQKRHVDKIDKNLMDLRAQSRKHLQKIGIVRFSAFSGVGSDLSFAIAVMDSEGNGVVLSSIYGRDDNRIYAKPLENGQSKYRLSAEEEMAIKKAID
ncbi:MAG: DUF4446 family protein [Bacillota bacterium]